MKSRSSSPRWRVGAGTVGIGMLLAAGAALGAGTASAASAGCGADIQVSDQSGQVACDATLTALGEQLYIAAQVPALDSAQLLLAWPSADGTPECLLGQVSQAASQTRLGPYLLDTRSFAGAEGSGTSATAQSGTPAACAPGSGVPAVNGSWSVSLQLTDPSGAVSTQSFPFVLAIPPAPVTGVTATSSGENVTVAWNPGTEPDLTGYQVLTAADQPVGNWLTPAEACASSPCSTSFAVAGPGTYQFVVRDERSTAPNSSQSIVSADSSAASVTVPADPSPAASPASSPPPASGSAPGATSAPGGSGSGGSPGSSANGGSAPPPATASELFARFLPSRSAPAIPILLPGPVQYNSSAGEAGGYQVTLPYGASPAAGTAVAAGGGHDPAVLSSAPRSGAPIFGRRIALPVAAGLLLLLVAGHLTRWQRAPQPRSRSAGTSARA